MLTYPNKHASYPVPVRQLRLLPVGLLTRFAHEIANAKLAPPLQALHLLKIKDFRKFVLMAELRLATPLTAIITKERITNFNN